MGGSSGGIIVRRSAVGVLTDPIVHGQLTEPVACSVDPILSKDPSTWSDHDCDVVANAYHWALCHLK